MPQGGELRSHRIEDYHDVILAVIEDEVEFTLVELAELLCVSTATPSRPAQSVFSTVTILPSKNSTRQRAGTARRRRPAQAWFDAQPDLDSENPV